MQRNTFNAWLTRFWLTNLIFYIIVAASYAWELPNLNTITAITWKGKLLAWVFFTFASVGQMWLFMLVGFLCVFLLAWLVRRGYRVFQGISVLLGSMIWLFLIVDAVVFNLYHLHLAGVVWHVVSMGVASSVFALSTVELILAISLVVIILAVEIVAAWWLNRYVRTKPVKKLNWLYWVLPSAFLLTSYGMYSQSILTLEDYNATTSNTHVLQIEGQVVPYYYNTLSFILPGYNLNQLETLGNGLFQQLGRKARPLDYPKQPLSCHVKKRYNVVVILLDAWRYDEFNKRVTPNIYQFANGAWRFHDQYSGGNCTGPGVFSLFYGIPYNYWTAMLLTKTEPVLIQQFMQAGYQMKILRSASLHYPAFDQTVFAHVPDLRIDTPGKTAADRDRKITRDFVHFIDHRHSDRPFFSFIFYDETHNYCESGSHYAMPFKPYSKECDRLALTAESNPVPMKNRQRNAAYFDDGLVGQVLASLKKHHLLQKTIVIISADHGEQFNDTKQGFWGHASNYSIYQTHVPLIVYWPGRGQGDIRYQTTHYDLVPTLMKKLFACKTPAQAYTVGSGLFSAKQPDYFIVNSYVDYAILTHSKIFRIYPQGNYLINNRKGELMKDQQLNVKLLLNAEKQLNRYYH